MRNAALICSCTLGSKIIRFILAFQYCMGQIKWSFYIKKSKTVISNHSNQSVLKCRIYFLNQKKWMLSIFNKPTFQQRESLSAQISSQSRITSCDGHTSHLSRLQTSRMHTSMSPCNRGAKHADVFVFPRVVCSRSRLWIKCYHNTVNSGPLSATIEQKKLHSLQKRKKKFGKAHAMLEVMVCCVFEGGM